MKNEVVNFEVEINVPQEKIFNFMTNPKNIPLVLPGLIENTNVPKLPLKNGSKFNYKYQMFGVVLEGDTIIDNLKAYSEYDFSTTGDIESHWKQKLINNKGSTKFVLEVNYSPPRSVLDKIKLGIVEKLNKKEAEQYLHNIKTVLEMQS